MNTELDNDTAFNIDDFKDFVEKKLLETYLPTIKFEQAINYLFNVKLYLGREHGYTINLTEEVYARNKANIDFCFTLFIYSVYKHNVKDSKGAYQIHKEYIKATCTEEEINNNVFLKNHVISYDDLDQETKYVISLNFALMNSFL